MQEPDVKDEAKLWLLPLTDNEQKSALYSRTSLIANNGSGIYVYPLSVVKKKFYLISITTFKLYLLFAKCFDDVLTGYIGMKRIKMYAEDRDSPDKWRKFI